MLRLSADAYTDLVVHALDGLPIEACGLLVGRPSGPVGAGAPDGAADVTEFVPTANRANSAKVYEVDPLQHLRAERDAESRGLEIVGVMHSHTHTAAYPSPTDVVQAPDPGWHYLIVSLADGAPVVRSYRIIDGNIAEESVVVVRQ